MFFGTLQLPKGTHEWSKFLTPEELALILHRSSISVSKIHIHVGSVCLHFFSL